MMNPRSAPVTSMAESITSASTSSSTRADPRARRPSSREATCRKSATAGVLGPEERAGIVQQEDQFGAALHAEPDLVAVPEHALGDRLVVDKRSAAGSAVPKQPAAVVALLDLGMLAGNVDAAHAQIALGRPADSEQRLVEGTIRLPCVSLTCSLGVTRDVSSSASGNDVNGLRILARMEL